MEIAIEIASSDNDNRSVISLKRGCDYLFIKTAEF
jgi:hypothetical protein